MAQSRRPPVWWMGLTNATFGLYAGFGVVTLPQMLAAQGIPGGRIAAIVAAVLSPGFWVFLLAPILDVRLNRRSYALVFSLIAASAIGITVTFRTRLHLIEAVMLVGYIAASLVQSAVGGWMSSLITPEEDGRLGAWFSLSNIGSGGLFILFASTLITNLRPALAGILVGSVILLPSLLYLRIPAPAPSFRPLGESFRHLFRDIVTLLKRRDVLFALALFILPSASFTLTNVLAGVGADFRASERTVSLVAGIGASVAGALASLLLPPLAKRLPLRPLYLSIGVVGAFFTLALLLLPRNPTAFAIAVIGENAFQALAFAASNAITFEVIGPGNPVAATVFSLFIAASNLPIVYMGFVDGRAYTWRGIPGSFFADAAISLAMCLFLGAALILLRTRGPNTAHLPPST